LAVVAVADRLLITQVVAVAVQAWSEQEHYQ
jgi:hypothetical protein